MPEFPMPKLEELVLNQIVDRFFEPELIGYEQSPQPVFQPTPTGGQQTYPLMPKYQPAPLADTARHIYDVYGEQIASKIWERIDLDELVEKLATRTMETLTTRNGFGDPIGGPRFRAIQDKVDNRLVEIMAADQLAKIREAERLAKLQYADEVDPVDGASPEPPA